MEQSLRDVAAQISAALAFATPIRGGALTLEALAALLKRELGVSHDGAPSPTHVELAQRVLELVRANPEVARQMAQATATATVAASGAHSVVVGADQRGMVMTGDGAIVQLIQIVAGPSTSEAHLARLHNLPSGVRDFTGREAELGELRAARNSSVVAISGLQGMGGIGKTELGLVLARELVADYPDAQIFVDLRGSRSKPRSVVDAMSEVILAFEPTAKPPEAAEQIAALYRSTLHAKRVLLFFDDALDAAQVEPLLPPSSCFAIVTSRSTFDLPGMNAKRIDELASSDSAALALKIAPRLEQSIEFEHKRRRSADVLAELCGHLPLAVRVAASTISCRRDLEIGEYLERLQSGKTRLGAVDASIALSFELLDERARDAWLELSVFPKSFDRAAALAVWDQPDDAGSELLSDLVKRNVVDFDESSRRYRLHDVVRAFTRDRIDPTTRDAAELRHAAHYLDLLTRADDIYLQGGDLIATGLALFDFERDNMTTSFARMSGRRDSDRRATEICGQWFNAGVTVLAQRLDPRERIEHLKLSLNAARRLGDRGLEGAYLANLGHDHASLDEIRTATEYYEAFLAITRDFGDRESEGRTLYELGVALAWLSETRKAAECFEASLVIARDAGDREAEADIVGELGLAYSDLGETRKGIEHIETQLVIARELGDRAAEGQALNRLGCAHADCGDARKSIEHYEAALAIAREIDNRPSEGAALGNLGIAYAELGQLHKSLEYRQQALEISREIGDRRDEGRDIGNLGCAYAELGDTQKAIELFDERLAIARETGDRQGEAAALGSLGCARAKLGETREAIELFQQSLGISRDIGYRRGEGQQIGALGRAFADLHETGKATEHFETALSIARAIGDRAAEGDLLDSLSGVYAGVGETHRAIEHAERAHRILVELERPNAQRIAENLRQWRESPESSA